MADRVATGAEIWTSGGGRDGPLLMLLHGLGANADVWQGMLPLVERDWPGRWVAPDLRGHGRSGHRGPYGYAQHAADMAALLGQHEQVTIVGHSMGGVVGLAMASGWYGVKVRFVVAFGMKIRWTPDEVTKLHGLGLAPVKWFATEAEAIDRYLKVSGLFGLIDPAGPVAKSGVRAEGGRWRLASDPGINGAAGPDVADFVRASKAPFRLAAGAKDPMVVGADMEPFDPNPEIFTGIGHNVQVENPSALWDFVRRAIA